MPESLTWFEGLGLGNPDQFSNISEDVRTSLPGKTMEIGGHNDHVSHQSEGDKVALLVHGMPDDGSCWKYRAHAPLNAATYGARWPETLEPGS